MPEQARLTDDEVWRIRRVRLALRLNKLPHELDDAPLTDVMDMLEVLRTDDNLAQMQAARGRRG
jgi:hypothetical protein